MASSRLRTASAPACTADASDRIADSDRVARRNARVYLVGLTASLLGNSAMSLVAGIWVKSLTGSSAEAGLVSACAYAPALAGPVAGLIVDRVDRRRWLIGVNFVSAATVLTLLSVHSAHRVWVIFAAMAAYGTELVLIDPAESALFAEMLPEPIRLKVNGLRLGIQETGRLVAPLLGAALFTALGGGAVATLDAATFLVAAAAVALLRIGPRRMPEGRGRLLSELLAGARHVVAVEELRRVTIAATAVMAASGVGVAAQYSLVSALGERPAFLGVLAATLGAGSIAASLASGRAVTRIGEQGLALAGLINYAVGELLAATGWLPAALLGWAVLGFALPWVYLATLNLAQRVTPMHLQGRVAAAITLALFGPGAPAQALGALVISHASYRRVYVVLAVVGFVLAGWLALRARRPQRSRPSPRG